MANGTLFQTILCPVDFSNHSRQALACAALLTARSRHGSWSSSWKPDLEDCGLPGVVRGAHAHPRVAEQHQMDAAGCGARSETGRGVMLG